MSQRPRTNDLASHTDLLEKIAHDLRGPAGVTLGALEELELSLGKGGEHTSLVEMAQRGIRKILRTAERLTRLSRLAATEELARAPVDLAHIVREVCTEVAFLEGRRNVKVASEVPAEPQRALGDDAFLRALVGELISQALRSAKSTVGVALTRADGALVLTVRDDGASGERPQALAPRSADGEGPQLRSDPVFALMIAADIARLHGATLELSPEVTPGLAVRLTLKAS